MTLQRSVRNQTRHFEPGAGLIALDGVAAYEQGSDRHFPMLVRLAPDQHRFIICTHHAVLDGWSSWILLGELAQLYERRGDATGLPAPPPYADYDRWLAKPEREAAQNAWRAAHDVKPVKTLEEVKDDASAAILLDEAAQIAADLAVTAAHRAAPTQARRSDNN